MTTAADEDAKPTPPHTQPRGESFLKALTVFRYIHPYRHRFLAAIAALLVATLTGLSFPYLTGLMLDAAVAQERGTGWSADINTIALILVGTLALQAIFSFFATYSFSRCGESALVDLRRQAFSKLIGLPMSFFAQRRVGELTARLTGDLAILQDTLTGSAPQFIRQMTLMLGGIAMVAFTSLRLTGLMLSTFPLLVLAAIFIGKRIRRHSRVAQDRLADANTVLEESLHGIASVKAFTAEPREATRYSHHLNEFLAVIFRVSRLRASLVSFIIFGVFGSIVAVFWYGSSLMQAGDLTFGELTRFILYTTFVGGSVASFADLFGHLQRSLGATERVRELLSEEAEVSIPSAGAGGVHRLSGAVEFRDVCFSYPSRPGLPVLRNLNLQAAPGEKIAFVGASGAGKSTIVSLLLRFYDPSSGSVLIDGKTSTDLSLYLVRANTAIVPQEVLLFGGSIHENILYGRPDATPDEVRTAAQQALCEDFILRFPEGYETLVGERGVKLSGGQRQRIAIARALLKNPAILILDEATSSLDSANEHLIQQALETLLVGRTSFIIAHRLSTVRKADRIYVLEEGRIIEEGHHDDLASRPGGAYRRLCEIQLSA